MLHEVDCIEPSVQKKIIECCDKISDYIVCMRRDVAERNMLILTIKNIDGDYGYRKCSDCLTGALSDQIEGGFVEKHSIDNIMRISFISETISGYFIEKMIDKKVLFVE